MILEGLIVVYDFNFDIFLMYNLNFHLIFKYLNYAN